MSKELLKMLTYEKGSVEKLEEAPGDPEVI